MLITSYNDEQNEKRREKHKKTTSQNGGNSLTFAGNQLLGMQTSMVQSMNSSNQQWDARSQKAQQIANVVAKGRKMIEVDKYKEMIRQKALI